MDALKKLHNDDLGKLLLRLTVAGLMLFHGVGKLRGDVDKIGPAVTGAGLPEWVKYGVIIGEVLAPALILVGFWTRPAALVLALNMVVAVLLAHRKQIFTMTDAGTYALELQAFYFFAALAILFLGPGRWSISRGQGVMD